MLEAVPVRAGTLVAKNASAKLLPAGAAGTLNTSGFMAVSFLWATSALPSAVPRAHPAEAAAEYQGITVCGLTMADLVC